MTVLTTFYGNDLWSNLGTKRFEKNTRSLSKIIHFFAIFIFHHFTHILIWNATVIDVFLRLPSLLFSSSLLIFAQPPVDRTENIHLFTMSVFNNARRDYDFGSCLPHFRQPPSRSSPLAKPTEYETCDADREKMAGRISARIFNGKSSANIARLAAINGDFPDVTGYVARDIGLLQTSPSLRLSRANRIDFISRFLRRP